MELNLKWKLLLLALLIVALTSRLGYLQLSFEEPRRAEVSMEMMINENYIVPTINNTYYYNKPPFYNWLMIVVFKSFQTTNEWSVRIITVLSFLAIGVLTFFLTNRYFNRRAAWLAGFFLLTTGDILYRFSLSGEIDVFYALLVFLQAAAIFHFGRKEKFYLLFAVSYLLCAMGFLTKGLTSPAFQVFTLLGWAFTFRKYGKLFSLQHALGIMVFFSILGAYFYAYSGYNSPAGFIANLVSESTQRTVADGSALNYVMDWLNFPWMFLSVMLPWPILLVLITKERWQKLWENDLIKFSLVFIFSNLILYWLSPGTRPRYLYPFIPFAMIFLAGLFEQNYEKARIAKYLEYLWLGIIGILLLGFAVAPIFNIPEAIKYPITISVVFVILFGLLFWLFLKHRNHRIWIFIAALIIIRFAFNMIVLPVRNQEDIEINPYREMVRDLVVIAEGERIWLKAPMVSKRIEPTLLGIEMPEASIETIPWPSYQISFYLAEATSKVLSWDDTQDPTKLYLMDKQYQESDNLDIIKTYYIPNKNREYILFRFLP